ncbi:MAG TPA: class I SAM-dependent DNA methyltransferase, partial [Myxococcota bacterium]|nr:class I SAM-dependent DNA methyltransferase [Myxococcota bacterium]
MTREVAAHLAGLARDLEAQKHDPETVARFLMRCLFTMFAEDVALLEDHIFTRTLADVWIAHPERFPAGIESLWHEMDRGGLWGAHPIRRFNGGLFREVHALPLTVEQLQRLLAASRCDWSDVEPAIFGTLLERALSTVERHKLGAHFTPREYIERLVRPTVIEPLRAEWDAVRAAARQVLESGEGEPTPSSRRQAVALVHGFHKRLCDMRVLDPACGTGNFLYVTFDLVKQLEAEVLRELSDLGEGQASLELAGVRVIPEQFLGIETNPRAQAIAELVLWLGALQWALRTGAPLTDPILHDAHNIECRDAVLAHDLPVMRRDPATGRPVTVWDMRTKRKHPVTGRMVPDENAQVPLWDHPNARPAEWPEADFIVSNPPFLGNKRMREALGDGYTEALRAAWPDVDGSADLVMYWWEKAAALARKPGSRLRRFGFITTNSVTQAFNRKVLERHLSADTDPLAVAWAIPDHPWVLDGAAVRIAMSVGCRADALAAKPTLGRVTREADPEHMSEGAARLVDVAYRTVHRIHADLSGGANVAAAVPLKANQGLSYQGMNLVGKGFRISRQEVRELGYDPDDLPPVIRPYMNARELTQTAEDRFVIDFFGLSAEDARERYPRLFQVLLERVKPERDHNKDLQRRRDWWLFGRSMVNLRNATNQLPRYIVTPEISK